MTEAERAYAAAEREIEKAIENEERGLVLSGEEFDALEAIPPSISNLGGLDLLDLDNTQVADLSPLKDLAALSTLFLNGTPIKDLTPLKNMSLLTELSSFFSKVRDLSPLRDLTSLERLYLASTPVEDLTPLENLTALRTLELGFTYVTDLRPIRQISSLVENPKFGGLSFQGCHATLFDQEIDRISVFQDPSERARTLFAYLEDWEPPQATQYVPKPDALFPVDQTDTRLEVARSTPTEQDHEDVLKRAMHQSLPGIPDRLAQAAGNQFPRLADLARRISAMLDRPYEDLDFPTLHLAFNELRAIEQNGREDGMAFPQPLTTSLTSACDAGGGLTLDNPLVDLLMTRARKARENPDSEEDQAAQDDMSRSVAEDTEAMGERLRALETQVLANPDAQSKEAQKAVNRNVLWRIGVGALSVCGVVVGEALIGEFIGQPVVAFVKQNLPVLKKAALTYGQAFADWFLSAVSKLL